jgi:hypothetical protein
MSKQYVEKKVIENKLLVALTEEDKVAIVVTEQELKDLIKVLTEYKHNTPVLPTRDFAVEDRDERIDRLVKGMEDLYEGAFSK